MVGRNTLIILAVAAAVSTAATIAVYGARPSAARVTLGDPALPTLSERINEAARLSVRSADESFTLALDPETSIWGLVERGGYPADTAIVRTALAGLAGLRLDGPRTARPYLYSRIGVEDVDSDDSSSLEVTVADAEGAPLGALIIGRQRPGALGAAGAARYIRRVDEAQSWLATGTLDIRRDATGWLERRLMDIQPLRVSTIRIEGSDRPPLVLVREPETDDMRIVDLPDDRIVERQYQLESVAAVLDGLDLIDVRPAEDLPVTDGGRRAVFTTFDGLVVTCRIVPDPDDGETLWLRFETALHPPPGGAPLDGDGQPLFLSDEAVAGQAESLETRLAPWVFRIPVFKAERLVSTVEDITEPAN